ncbi:MAG: response regulator [Lawsonibacter sp.]|nr:response regulator [Lawsonibacter sp.]
MLKVLVVEDEEMIRKGIVLAVDWAAMDCVVVGEAANGVEALEAVERLNPSLIITDLKMPRMDGIEMLRCLRDRGNHVYVIILTAYDSFTYAQSALRLGAVDFLLKPFHDGDLEQAVTALRRRMGGAEREEPALPGLKKGDKSKYVLEAMDYIGKHYQDPNISISDIALDLGISEGHLSRTFKKETDYTLLNYLTRYRIHKAMELLRDCRVKVYEVAAQVGYRDITYFSATFKRVTGVTPSEYQDTSGNRREKL